MDITGPDFAPDSADEFRRAQDALERLLAEAARLATEIAIEIAIEDALTGAAAAAAAVGPPEAPLTAAASRYALSA